MLEPLKLDKQYLYRHEKMQINMPKFPLLIPLLVASISLSAQTKRAESLLPNVVTISAAGQQGFGFITGSRYDKLFVVTAAHIVRDATTENLPIEIKLYDDYNRYTGRIIRNYSPEQDIALLEISKPKYFSWSKACLGQVRIGEDVGFIGRNGNWYIPRGRALGTINSFEQDQIIVDITSVTIGTSGAPLIAKSGIVGMIISADDVEVRAISVDQLRTTLTEEYQYFFAITATDGVGSSSPPTRILSNPMNDTESSEEPSTEAKPLPSYSNQIKDRQGNIYTIKIMEDHKQWMMQNLKLEVEDSWCYKNNPSTCHQFGRLYTWEAARRACTELGDGWYLPADEEWQTMMAKYGEASYDILLQGGQNGFAAKLSGWRHPNGSFGGLGSDGYYWSNSTGGNSQAWYYAFDQYTGQLSHLTSQAGYGFSVRCVKDGL